MATSQHESQRVALVTGASSGIGRAAARALSEAGFGVVGTSRNAAKAAPLDGVTFLDLDVTRDESVIALVTQVIERFGRIDVLVNNAGVGMALSLIHISEPTRRTPISYAVFCLK